MRLLFVSKRHPQQRDLIAHPYGRFHHLPAEMVRLGHEVRVQLISHRRLGSAAINGHGVDWSSHDLFGPGRAGAIRRVREEAREFRPDWIIGCSDAWVGVLAHRLSRYCNSRLVIDAYDNFESYMPWNLPLHLMWRRAVLAADTVAVAGPQLASLLNRYRKKKAPPVVVPMAADPHFTPRDKQSSRVSLGLPSNAPLIGYMGAWSGSRGTNILLEAFRRVRRMRPQARLVLSGRPSAAASSEPGAISLGFLEDAVLPDVLSSLDIAAIITNSSSFSQYSYPAKLYEAMACHIPVVATASDPVRWILRDDSNFLAPVADPAAIASRMLALLDGPNPGYPTQLSWSECARVLDAALDVA